MHLLHLIGAHHGEPQFGSPVARRRRWRFITSTIWMRASKCLRPVTPLPNRWARIFDRVRRCGKFGEVAGKISASTESPLARGQTSVTRYKHTQIGHVIIWSLLAIILIASGGLMESLSHREPPVIVSIILLASSRSVLQTQDYDRVAAFVRIIWTRQYPQERCRFRV